MVGACKRFHNEYLHGNNWNRHEGLYGTGKIGAILRDRTIELVGVFILLNMRSLE